MRLKKTLVLIVVLLSVTLMLASCGEKKGETKTIVIGLTAPLSGSGAGYGEDIKAGLDMAIKKVNDAGGITIGDIKYNFKLDSSDDAMVPEQALTNANQFVLEQGVNTIWDPTANTIQPLLGVNTKAGEEFLIMAYSSVPLYAQAPNKLMVTLPHPSAFTSHPSSRWP